VGYYSTHARVARMENQIDMIMSVVKDIQDRIGRKVRRDEMRSALAGIKDITVDQVEQVITLVKSYGGV